MNAAAPLELKKAAKQSGVEINYDYKDAPTIRKFANSDAFIRGLMGPFGSGKSSGCVLEIIQRALAQKPGPDGIRRTRWAVIRNTYPQLRDTTIKTFMQWFPENKFGRFYHQDHTFIIDAIAGVHIEIMFRAMDRPEHVANLLSLELTGSWVNEAREVPWTIIEALMGRVGRYPAMKDGGPTWHGIFMDTNPPDVDSKWYKFFEESHDKPEFVELYKQIMGVNSRVEDFVAIFKQPSGLSPEAENLPNLIGGSLYYKKLSLGKDPEWVKVYCDGQYGFVIDGKTVYPQYIDHLHCRPVRHLKYEPA